MNRPPSIDEQVVGDLLAAAGVDQDRRLRITAQTVLSRTVDVEYVGPWQLVTEAEITGPKALRREARRHLLDRAGLACAPYPDHDLYTLPEPQETLR